MYCPKCGNSLNNDGTCLNCGLNINQINQQSNVNQNTINTQNSINSQIYQNNNQSLQSNDIYPSQNLNEQTNYYNQNINQPNSNNQSLQMANNVTSNMSISLNFISYFISIMIKPFKIFKEESSKLNNAKNSLVLGIIVSVIMTLISIVKSMISAVKVTTGGFISETKTTWEWSNLKELNYLKLIGQNLLIYIGIIFAVALVFYLASLVIKKQTTYPKMVAISASAFVPFIVGCMVLSPILANISVHVGVIISIVSIVYTLVIFNEFINSEIAIDGDIKIYFNLICYSLILLICYFILVKYLGSLLSGFGLGSISNYGF